MKVMAKLKMKKLIYLFCSSILMLLFFKTTANCSNFKSYRIGVHEGALFAITNLPSNNAASQPNIHLIIEDIEETSKKEVKDEEDRVAAGNSKANTTSIEPTSLNEAIIQYLVPDEVNGIFLQAEALKNIRDRMKLEEGKNPSIFPPEKEQEMMKEGGLYF